MAIYENAYVRVAGAVMAGGIGVAALTGCTPGEHHSSSVVAPENSSASVTAAVPKITPKTAPSPQTASEYAKSKSRNDRLTTVAQHAASRIVAIYQGNAANPWGPFDAYCGGASGNGTEYTSLGYKMKPGDICDIAHNPQYGGTANQIDVRVPITADGPDALKVTDVFFVPAKGGPDTCAIAELTDMNGVWHATYATPADYATFGKTTGAAETAHQVQVIDNEVINCLVAQPN
jgi:hypothetical protein